MSTQIVNGVSIQTAARKILDNHGWSYLLPENAIQVKSELTTLGYRFPEWTVTEFKGDLRRINCVCGYSKRCSVFNVGLHECRDNAAEVLDEVTA